MTFCEVRYTTRALTVLLVVFGVGLTASILIAGLPDMSTGGERAGLIGASLFGLALCVGCALMSSVVRVGPDGVELELRLGFSIWHRQIPWSELEGAEVEPLSALRSGGLGLRSLGGGRMALLVRPGTGVVMRLRGGRRSYVVASDRAGELLEALNAPR
ncbi:hypothetical protein [Cellulomonas bogoriensis]|uniref:Bacterial Pleckstrin homology domain-containing protein n=2 Tax=Cellulomonas bogoriensis TaxID=301388 RepID=A0A0A0C062_9CELL|nr:hypothetical protein N869_13060 [Cellulomonas bogoriensis 69B4 = DSM 16987]